MNVKVTFSILLLISFLKPVYAQNYLLDFSASGAVSSIDSIQVSNLTQGTQLSIDGSDILNLTSPVGINTTGTSNFTSVFPNPTSAKSIIRFSVTQACNADIKIFDISGKECASITQKLNTSGTYEFSLSNIPSGMYILKIDAGKQKFSHKIISASTSDSDIKLNYIGQISTQITYTKSNVRATISMDYNDNDVIVLRSFSGKYITNDTIVPTENQSVDINFAEAVDNEGYSYPTVVIGTQTWIAENMKTTTYPDGSDITLVESNSLWTDLADDNTSDAYCWYDNDEATYATPYGAMYTWAAAMGDNAVSSNTIPSGVQGICPAGWHIPSNEEWNQLANYLGTTSDAGAELKESGTEHWDSPNSYANNSTGFYGLPGGRRTAYSGEFSSIRQYGNFWTSTEDESNPENAYRYSLSYTDKQFNKYSDEKGYGYSVRCIKN